MTLWNKRYASQEYIFGKAPNLYFKSIIDQLKPGKILIPGAGEGRDAVYAAKLGWEVHAFDLSPVGKEKALLLAASTQTTIHYEVLDASDFKIANDSYDLVAMTFFHLQPEIRRPFFSQIQKALAVNGKVLIEAFHPDQMNFTSGGPSDLSMLLTTNILLEELALLCPLETCETRYVLDEGPQHQGEAAVTRYLGIRR